MLALMGLIPWPGKVTADRLTFDGKDILACSAPRQRRRIIGKDIAMIFQEPMTSLNPCFTVGFQIMETLRVHEGGSRAERRAAHHRAAGPGRHPRARLAPRCLPPSALRRHEPAGHDRHGDRLQSRAC